MGCSQSREWGHQGWLGHFKEGQKGLYQVQRAQERVELWVISFLEIGCMFPLIVVDINELSYLCGSRRAGYRPFTANVDGESQSSKEVMNQIL